MGLRLVALALLTLSACAPVATGPETPSRAATTQSGPRMPPMKVFGEAPLRPVTRANAEIARDFLDLAFALESGRSLQRLTRFEGPIRVRVTGAPPPGMSAELDRVLARMRREAGLDIARSTGAAGITIQAVPGASIRRYLPQAACFVVPNITRLSQYSAARRRNLSDWAGLDERETIAIFIPNDVSPQEVRDCLHEELAQALGPLNDLYRLPDSVFNDDNIHTVLTPFDMLILRAYYDPALHSGMSRDEVAARLPAILARLNPGGEGRPARFLPETPRAWTDAIQNALGPGASPAARTRAAGRALAIAESEGWTDHRLAFSHYAYARLTQGRNAESALTHYRKARAIYAARPETEIHNAYVAAQLAAHSIARGDGAGALRLLRGQPELARRYENGALLASLLMLRAEALDQLGRSAEARAVRRDSLGWARFGFGPEWAVRAKLSEIASLNPQRTGG
ncbi:DUF2927 domain-containing protein [Pseudooceanicola pacificus]|uniref:DUF2927 domain-containing protein n=1 Tax=Pseudooceanicola pacificus TaxID=2676438 RepID=UPI001921A7C2|nr:DUF2927 domain-containing protein [Pseudooceanicola pacificus]